MNIKLFPDPKLGYSFVCMWHVMPLLIFIYIVYVLGIYSVLCREYSYFTVVVFTQWLVVLSHQ